MGIWDTVQDAIKKTTPGLSSGAQEELTRAGITSAAGTNPVSQVHVTSELGKEGYAEETMGLDPKDWVGTRAEESERQAAVAGQSALELDASWLNYLKGLYEPFSDVASAAIGQQAGLAGLGGPGQQQQFIDEIEADPFYQAKVRAGDEAIGRNAAMTGKLRSGNTMEALAEQNQALLGQEIDQRYQQLAGLSGQGFMGSSALGTFGGNTIGNMTGTMGAIQSGNVAADAAKQARADDMIGTIGSVAAGIFSDERLKTNITKVGEKHGIPWYKWEWNETAYDKYNLKGAAEGHMATDVELNYPKAVGERDGYRTVNYEGLN